MIEHILDRTEKMKIEGNEEKSVFLADGENALLPWNKLTERPS